MKPISPEEITKKPILPLLDQAIVYINNAIKSENWHRQIVEVDGYHAIIMPIAENFRPIRGDVVKLFTDAGWDCKWQDAYDARGPHNCFYVHKKHFK